MPGWGQGRGGGERIRMGAETKMGDGARRWGRNEDGGRDEDGRWGRNEDGADMTRTGQAPSLPDTKDEFNIVENFTRLCFR